MPTQTTNYDLLKPLVNNATDQDLWGDQLNGDMDDIDALLRVGITIDLQSIQTSGFTADASISVKKLYPCDATGGAFSATIPLAATVENGATVFIKKIDASANAVTLARSGSDTLDGLASLSLSAQQACYALVSDGISAWQSITMPVVVPVIPDASTSVKGIIQIATSAEALAGLDALKAVTSAGLASSKSLAQNGYYKFPGGLIVQWGINTTSGTPTVSFPIAFPTAIYSLVCGIADSASAGVQDAKPSSVGLSSFVLKGSNYTGNAYWIAIGN